jgi:hypothetical protein
MRSYMHVVEGSANRTHLFLSVGITSAYAELGSVHSRAALLDPCFAVCTAAPVVSADDYDPSDSPGI